MPEPATPPESPRHRADIAVAAIFLLAIFLPALGYAVHARPPVGSEKRNPKPVPVLADAKHPLWTFPDRFTSYFNDRFTFRADMVRIHALAIYCLLDSSPSSTVLIGHDGWFFYADDNCLDDFRSQPLFTKEELVHWRDILEARRAWLASRGIRFLVVFVPDKHIVYPQFMPPAYHRRGVVTRMDQLTEYLLADTTIDVVNTTPAILRAAAAGRIYHKTDSHWNDRGALVGYQEIMNRLAEAFPRVRPLPAEAFEPVTEMSPGWDLPAMLRLTDVISEENLALRPRTPRRAKVVHPAEPNDRWNDGLINTEVDDAALPRAVVFRDSFSSALVPFMAEHFSRITFSWQSSFDLDILREEKPNVVILEIAGRKLYQIEPFNPDELQTAAH
ncbi:MAG: hypothetical protein NTW19_14810 [Planctomycetota bacterium]|nr:hypothetical protein [Planctomycetota bacterium]